ncbi:MAG: type II toxin-antitoxin system VapC family toxin [Bryobacteraceae bacterium]
MISYLDTNVVYRLTLGGESGVISERARQQMERTDLLISAMVLLELEMLYEIGKLRVGAKYLVTEFAGKIGLKICDLPMSTIVASSLAIKWTREPGDRLIVANAIANNEAPLISSDRSIRAHYANTIW